MTMECAHTRSTGATESRVGEYIPCLECEKISEGQQSARRKATAIISAVILLAVPCRAAVPKVDQESRWKSATVNPKNRIALDVITASFLRNEWRYQEAANARPGTIPAVVICAFHCREADGNWKTNLGQGDPLSRRTTHVPKGRIPGKEPPYSWQEAAIDALFVTDHMDRKDWKTMQGALDAAESYNGMGYRRYGIPSPYLFSGTSVYTHGKFSSDGHFSPLAVDQQLGCVAIWKAMQSRGIEISFAPWPKAIP